MNILIYIPELTQANGGIKQYTVALLKILINDQDNHYFVYHNSDDPDIISLICKFPRLKKIQDVDIIFPKKKYWKGKFEDIKKRLSERSDIKIEGKKISFTDALCTQFDIDIIHCTYPHKNIPHSDKSKLIVTLHDVQELHFPENFTPEERAYRAITYLELLNKADRVIVSYDHIKKDIIRYFKVDSKKIEVLLLNMKNLWIDKFRDKDMVDIKHLGLPERFLLYPANTWQHKNHLALMSALAEAKEKYQVLINIVCTGHKNEHFAEIERLITQLDIADQVFFTGVVEEDVLYALYKTSTGVVIPTTYEAGSFPLYESILLHVPVICSNVTSLPETINNNDFVFDPFKIAEITNLMIKLWEDDLFRKRNTRHLKESSQQFQNNSSPLEQILNLYSEVTEN